MSRMPATERSTASQTPNEEPEIVQEESVPSDGKDVEGEKMMEEIKPRKGDEKAADRQGR